MQGLNGNHMIMVAVATTAGRRSTRTGSAVNNGNGTTSFYGRDGNFTGSAGSSIDRALNFERGQ
jgi:hypothetical protein